MPKRRPGRFRRGPPHEARGGHPPKNGWRAASMPPCRPEFFTGRHPCRPVGACRPGPCPTRCFIGENLGGVLRFLAAGKSLRRRSNKRKKRRFFSSPFHGLKKQTPKFRPPRQMFTNPHKMQHAEKKKKIPCQLTEHSLQSGNWQGVTNRTLPQWARQGPIVFRRWS